MNALYLAWMRPEHRWWPVGRLTREGPEYAFSYTKGALSAADEAGFRPHISFPDFHETYFSRALFPLFANRLLRRSRPDYEDFVQCLDLVPGETDPMVLLARSGGRRETDSFEVFTAPSWNKDGWETTFFADHAERSEWALRTLEAGERLVLHWEQSDVPNSLALRLAMTSGVPIGWVPRHVSEHIGGTGPGGLAKLPVRVVRVNPPPAPAAFRVLCRVSGSSPGGRLLGDQAEPLHREQSRTH